MAKRFSRIVLPSAAIMWAAVALGSGAAERTVTVPGDYATIVAAVFALQPDGGTIRLAGGPYAEMVGKYYQIPASWNAGARLTIEGGGAIWRGGAGGTGFDQCLSCVNWTGLGGLTLREIEFQSVVGVGFDAPQEFLLVVDNCTFRSGSLMASLSTNRLSDVRVKNCRFVYPDYRYGVLTFSNFTRMSMTGCEYNLQPAYPYDPSWLVYFNSTPQNRVGGICRMEFAGNRLDLGGAAPIRRYVELAGRMDDMALVGNDMPGGYIWLRELDREGRIRVLGNRFGSFLTDWWRAGGGGWDMEVRDNIFRVEREDCSFFDVVMPRRLHVANNDFLPGGYWAMLGQLTCYADPAKVYFHNNNLPNGLQSYVTGPIDLTNNYWGPEGPSYKIYTYESMLPRFNTNPYLSSPAAVGTGGYLGFDSSQGAAAYRVDLRVSPDEGRPPIDLKVYAHVSGGNVPYRYEWLVDGQLFRTDVASDSTSWIDRHIPRVETHNVRVIVTDQRGYVASDSLLLDYESETGTLWGFVRDADLGEPLPGAQVSLTDDEGRQLGSCAADTLGIYEFRKVRLGKYTMEASAPQYESTSQILTLATGGQRLETDFALSIPLDENRRRIKEKLIAELKKFPDTASWLDAVMDHAYEQVETQAASWVAAQTEMTEAFKRLEMAEWAAKQAGAQAMDLADQASGAYAGFIGQAIDIICSLKWVEDFLKAHSPAIFGLREKLVRRISWLSQNMVSSTLRLVTSQLTTVRGNHVIRMFIRAQLEEWLTQAQGAQGITLSNVIGKVIYRELLKEYGQTTSRWLEWGLAQAQSGGPYNQELDISSQLVRTDMAVMASKTAIALKAEASISLVSDLAAMFSTTTDFASKVVVLAPTLQPLEPVLNKLTLYFKAWEGGVNLYVAGMCTDRLLGKLPDDLGRTVADSFGYSPSAPLPLLMSPAGARSRSVASATMDMETPTTATVNAALALCRSRALADDLPGLADAVENQLLPALDEFDAMTDRLGDQAERLAGPMSLEFQQLAASRPHQAWQELLLLASTLNFLLRAQFFSDYEHEDYLAVRDGYLACLDAMAVANTELADLLIEMTTGKQTTQVPVSVAIRGVRVSRGGEATQWLTDSTQPIEVTVVLENITSGVAQGVLAAIDLPVGSGLSLASDSTTTQTVGAIDGNTTATAVWSLLYEGPTVNRMAFAMVQLAAQDPQTPGFEAEAPAIVLLGSSYIEDGDLDSMDDVWETDNGLNPADHDDGSGDADADGLINVDEFARRTRADRSDTDGDGMGDGLEIQWSLDPLVDDGDLDPDGDGLGNAQELARQGDPHRADTDGDGYGDGLEATTGSAVDNPESQPPYAPWALAVRDHLIAAPALSAALARQLDANGDGRLDIADLVWLINAAVSQ
ncbi:MAG: carboxypeptidase-like regulatory domain-containing protein [bacterium]|nr:carboxypeptidase-like regulatory domain-containing protein [bacterium]